MEIIQLPPEWVATSGCIVCLVLCCKALCCSLTRRRYHPYSILTTTELIFSIAALLFTILVVSTVRLFISRHAVNKTYNYLCRATPIWWDFCT